MAHLKHDCNAYCRAPFHAELHFGWTSGAPRDPIPPAEWGRLWKRELERGHDADVIDVQFAHEYEDPGEGPVGTPTLFGAYLVTFRTRENVT